MEKYTTKDRVSIMKTFWKHNGSITATRRALEAILGKSHVPAVNTIQRLVARFEETGSVADKRRAPPVRKARSSANIEAVRESLLRSPELSIRQRAKRLNISSSALHAILHKDLNESISGKSAQKAVSSKNFRNKSKEEIQHKNCVPTTEHEIGLPSSVTCNQQQNNEQTFIPKARKSLPQMMNASQTEMV